MQGAACFALKPCNGHGACSFVQGTQQGSCICDAGWFGFACQYSAADYVGLLESARKGSSRMVATVTQVLDGAKAALVRYVSRAPQRWVSSSYLRNPVY